MNTVCRSDFKSSGADARPDDSVSLIGVSDSKLLQKKTNITYKEDPKQGTAKTPVIVTQNYTFHSLLHLSCFKYWWTLIWNVSKIRNK